MKKLDYSSLISKNAPLPIESPPGLSMDGSKKSKYIFSITYTNPHTFQKNKMSDALNTAINKEWNTLTKYPDIQGYPKLRKLISNNLQLYRKLTVNPELVFLSSGAGGAIKTILDTFIDPGDIVLVEEFTYLGTLNMLLAKGAKVIHIPTDQYGIETEKLENTLKDLKLKNTLPKLICTIPVYQNPMGITMSLGRKKSLIKLSEKYQIPIIENESYADFRIDGPNLPPTLMSLDTAGTVIYVSAYTKLLGCGLRLGYAVLPANMQNVLSRFDSGNSPSQLASILVYEFLKNYRNEHVVSTADSLKIKRDTMLKALEKYFPKTCSWSKPNGGMMIWLKLPSNANTWTALPHAIKNSVEYNPGPQFHAGKSGKNFLRLTYSYNSADEIQEGIKILSEVFDQQEMFKQ